jgi:hypothetical protein
VTKRRRTVASVAGAAVLTGLAAVLMVVTGGHAEAGPKLVPPGTVGAGDGGGGGANLGGARAGSRATFFGMNVCLDRPGSLTVDGVRLNDAVNGLQVDTFALLPTTEKGLTAGELKPLSAFGVTPKPPYTLTAKADCRAEGEDPDGPLWSFYVQVSKPHGDSATAKSFTILYSSAGHHGELTVPLSIGLCRGSGDPESTTDPICGKQG